MKFLIIRFSSIGDIVLATPVLRCLKLQHPNAAIHFLTKQKFKAVSIANPYIDHFHYFDGDFTAMRRALQAERFDYVIDLHKNLRTFRLRLYLRCKWLSYRKLSVQKFLLTKLHWDIMPREHITTRSLNTLLPLGIKDDGLGLDYFIPSDETLDLNRLPASHQNGFGVIVIGASYFTKRLPVQKIVELVKRLNQPILLLGGPEDSAAGDEIVQLSNTKNVLNTCGRYKLNESADLVRHAAWVVSHDTGLQYIACAFQKRVLAVWGGTSPKLAVEPYYGSRQPANYRNFIVPDLPCQPCSNFGLKSCPKKHFNCMNLQDVDAIVREVIDTK